MSNDVWGWHFMLEMKHGELLKVQDGKLLEKFSIDLVNRISMKAYGPPRLEHFGHHDINLSGWTLVQLIETSSITFHTVDSTGHGFLDVFSCAPFDPEIVKKCVIEYFNPDKIESRFIERKIPD